MANRRTRVTPADVQSRLHLIAQMEFSCDFEAAASEERKILRDVLHTIVVTIQDKRLHHEYDEIETVLKLARLGLKTNPTGAPRY